MRVKQLKWILNKALFLLCAYEGRALTEKDCVDIISYAQGAYEDSKGDEYCKKIMLDAVCALDRESRERDGR